MKPNNLLSSRSVRDIQSTQLVDIEWRTSSELINYPDAINFMENKANAGSSANKQDLLASHRFPVFQTGRGGQYTYHGPGQRVVYLMLDLKKRGSDIKAYVRKLEEWLIATLAQFDIIGERREGRVGIWVTDSQNREKKIAAIGVRVRRWISFHGVSINVNPALNHYDGIVPCGISNFGITSLHDLKKNISFSEIDRALKKTFHETF
jgi:lipoyl(octanoyl) transferase